MDHESTTGHSSNNFRNNANNEEDIFDDSFMEIFENDDFDETVHPNKNETVGANNLLNVSALCCDEELNGYDKLTGQTWIYPTNYPVRDYQFNIIKAAMLDNCLVSLPTGLGKTFIAAVIMYNFYRWYPLGKIIFMAPTRPLVAQQIEACYNIVAMPPKDTIEMTGQMQVNTRKTHWETKRVFFATPQVIYNDIKSGMCPGDKIRCLVIDEAHKAKGNYAYGNIITTLTEMGHVIYRVLALSATPGNKVEDVIHIVKHLHISRLELRTENCLDVKAYSHARNINTEVVELGPKLTRLRQKYVEIVDVYTRKLKNFNIIQNLGNLSKGRIVMLYKEFQGRERGARHPQHNYIMRTFTLLITLYHGLELLVKHGSRVFLNFFDEHPEKTWVHFDNELTSFFEKLREELGVNPLTLNTSCLPDGSIPEMPSNLNFGHPKFDKLKEIMLKHFDIAKKQGQVTKAIVFCEYRESVNLVYCLLLQCRPTIVPEMFVGHGASGKDGKAVISQKQQLRVMRNFRSGLCNTLVCTCVAEEGLDVGSVDLIMCFDVSTRSPIRLVQRCGRTGRERSGQVYILVTEGREHSTLLDCIRQNDGLNQRILKSDEVKKNLYKSNPRMIPRDFVPECQKMYITVAKKEPKEKLKESKDKAKEKVLKGQKDLRTMFLNKALSSKSSQRDEKDDGNNELISKEEFDILFPEGYKENNFFSQSYDCWALKEFLKESNTGPILKASPQLELQKKLQNTFIVGNSFDTKILTELLQKNKETPITKSPAKKDGDIRVLFSKATKSIKDYTKSMKELGIKDNLNISADILNLLVDLSLENKTKLKDCFVCSNICKCSGLMKKSEEFIRPSVLCPYDQPVLPNIDLIDALQAESIQKLVQETENNMESHRTDSNSQTNFNNSDSNITIDSMTSDKGNKTKYVHSNALDVENKSNAVNCDDDDIFEETDIFDEMDISIEADIKTLPNESKFMDKRLSESTSREVIIDDHINISDDSDDSVHCSDNDNLCHIFEDDFNIDTARKKSPQRESLDKLSSFKVSGSSERVLKTSNEIKKTDMDLGGGINAICDENIRDYDLLEVNDIFDEIDEFHNLTLTKYTPALDHEPSVNNCAKSPILNTANKNNVERENNTDNFVSQKTCDEYNLLEVNDIFADLDTSEKLEVSEFSNHFKRFAETTVQNENKTIINNTENTRNVNKSDPTYNDVEVSNNVMLEKSVPLNIFEGSEESTVGDVNIENHIYVVLKYFHLNNVSDIFQYPKINNKLEENTIDKNSNIEFNETICDKKLNDSNEMNTLTECPLSPSLLSSLSKTMLSSRSTSPILNSQKPKTNIRLNRPKSPILNSQRRKLCLSVNRSKTKISSPTSSEGKTSNLVQVVNSILPGTEPDHRKTVKLEPQTKVTEIIILDSDDEDFEDVSKGDKRNTKRKFQNEVDCKSPYFNKKPKLDENGLKPSTIKEKIMAALTSHQNIDRITNNAEINYMLTPPRRDSQKENKGPFKSKLEILKKFQYDTKNKSNAVLNENAVNVPAKLDYNSDDDFVSQMPYKKKIVTNLKKERIKNTKKMKNTNEFLDLEAELSDDASVSDDELTDDSTNSIKEFICDDNETGHEDIHDIYLESVKSPVKGVFKLPQLPPMKKFDILSQYVEEDTYEMDSFCVDSHMILNETNEMSELELAEMLLEERRSRKNRKQVQDTQGSPMKKIKRKVKRQIHSESEDSS